MHINVIWNCNKSQYLLDYLSLGLRPNICEEEYEKLVARESDRTRTHFLYLSKYKSI